MFGAELLSFKKLRPQLQANEQFLPHFKCNGEIIEKIITHLLEVQIKMLKAIFENSSLFKRLSRAECFKA